MRRSAGWGTVLRGRLRHCYVSPCASFQALEYLLWASISVELSVPLMTAKYLPLSVTLYCAVCHCYYDNQAGTQAKVRSCLSASDQISGGFYQSMHRLGSLQHSICTWTLTYKQIPHWKVDKIFLNIHTYFKCFQEFARRALGKINERAEEDTATSIEARRAYKEASIKALTDSNVVPFISLKLTLFNPALTVFLSFKARVSKHFAKRDRFG